MHRTCFNAIGAPRLLTAICLLFTLCLFVSVPPADAGPTPEQTAFASPEAAAAALVEAAKTNDLRAMEAILGAGSREIISSGDEAADRTARERFVQAFEKKHSMNQAAPNAATLIIGENDWPLPLPIVRKGASWVFDTQKGRQEILNRRIGRNELRIIDVMHAYVDAQHDYASKNCSGSGTVEFAQRIMSSEYRRDGLYWEAKEGEDQSPLGPLVAQAAREGYANPDLSPFHGYYLKVLKGQGRHAEGGAYNYVVKGKMILGFGLAAYPAEYGNSGIMTFIVNQEGTVFQKNLGKDTRRAAESMKLFNPDKTWTEVKDQPKAN